MDLESPDREKRRQAMERTEDYFRYLYSWYDHQRSDLEAIDDEERTLVSYPVKWRPEARRPGGIFNNGEVARSMPVEKSDGRQWHIRKGAQTRCISYDLQSCKGTALEWVSGGRVRIPQEKTGIFRRGGLILAAGRPYAGTALLTVGKPPVDGWTTDFYGRQVYCYRERFPCFDSYDLARESRYFRWFFICQDGRLTRIHTEDGRPAIYVTEDVACLENMFWKKLEESGCFVRE